MNDIDLLELNYRYGNGFIKETSENTIRTKIQNLSLKIIKYKQHCDLVQEWEQERDRLY